jgi:subfamily B ATP-binding cassette protein MsbA
MRCLMARSTLVAPLCHGRLWRATSPFGDVVFAMAMRPPLRGLSFNARAGETTALVGAVWGREKHGLPPPRRLADPAEGEITLGGVPLRRWRCRSSAQSLSVVSQDARLFDESLRENIRLGRLSATDAEIRARGRARPCDGLCCELPQGLDTRVGPRGSSLSGGQRQRVAIARAFLRDAPVLLLDEPTSALDAESERLVQAALAALAGDRTTLVIAHRLSTIQAADRIVVMEAGRVVDTGTHRALLARGGLYRQLY